MKILNPHCATLRCCPLDLLCSFRFRSCLLDAKQLHANTIAENTWLKLIIFCITFSTPVRTCICWEILAFQNLKARALDPCFNNSTNFRVEEIMCKPLSLNTRRNSIPLLSLER